MPIYEYRCTTCGNQFEHLHARLNEEAPACPGCGAKKPKKQFSSFSASVAEPAAASCSLGSCPSAAGCCGGGCPREQ